MSDFTNDPRLKPCPLCGGHAHISEVVRTFGPSAYFAACDNQDCRLFEVPGMAHYRNSVDDAVAAWNTRAELGSGTCEYVIEDNMNETEGMGDVWFRCTNCDMCFDYADDWLLKMPYCPHCGARVKARNE